MKKLFIILISINIIACKTTKLDVNTGDKNPSWNTKHMRNVHVHGFWTGKKYIEYADQIKKPVRK